MTIPEHILKYLATDEGMETLWAEAQKRYLNDSDFKTLIDQHVHPSSIAIRTGDKPLFFKARRADLN